MSETLCLILTDREIRTALRKGVIVIDPPPSENAYSSTSVDLTLDHELTLFNEQVDGSGLEQIIDPSKRKIDAERAIEAISTKVAIADEGYVLHRNILILAYTAEYVDLRIDTKYAARIEGKSSLARYGLSVHITAPTIHAGFDGRIRLDTDSG